MLRILLSRNIVLTKGVKGVFIFVLCLWFCQEANTAISISDDNDRDDDDDDDKRLEGFRDPVMSDMCAHIARDSSPGDEPLPARTGPVDDGDDSNHPMSIVSSSAEPDVVGETGSDVMKMLDELASSWVAVGLSGWLACWAHGRLAGCLSGWPGGWLADGLAHHNML